MLYKPKTVWKDAGWDVFHGLLICDSCYSVLSIVLTKYNLNSYLIPKLYQHAKWNLTSIGYSNTVKQSSVSNEINNLLFE